MTIRAIPIAPRTMIAGRLGEAFRVNVRAPSSNGRANEVLCEFLAEPLAVFRRSVTLISPEKLRLKGIQVEGFSFVDLKWHLSASGV